MSRRQEKITYINVRAAVRRSGLGQQVVQECVERRLVAEPLTDTDLVQLRRIRRLRELGVNMPGIEIILDMRRRIERLQAQAGLRNQVYGRDWSQPDELWQRLLPWDEE